MQLTPVPASRHRHPFLSLRWRLLIGFTLVFSAVFAGAFYWFYTFSTDKAIARLRQDLRSTALGAAAGVDVEELLALYERGRRNPQGFSSDRRYHNQLEWFKTVHSVSPNVYAYTYIVGQQEHNRRVGQPAVAPGELEIVYLVDSLWVYIPERALPFLQSDRPSQYSVRAFTRGETVERDLYTDRWGSWISVYIPLRDDRGNIVAMLGADIEASHVAEVQQEIRDRVVLAFGITYGTLFLLVYVVSGVFTKPLNQLTTVAERIGEGDYSQNFSEIQTTRVEDEISTLAQVFELMVSKVRQREETLKQQVAELKIEIDQAKRQKQVSEIVDTDFFQDLVIKARRMRGRMVEEVANELHSFPVPGEYSASHSNQPQNF